MRLSAFALVTGFLLFQVNSPSFFGKNGPHSPVAADSLECAAMDLQKQLFAANPERQQLHQALENQAYQFLRQKQNPGQESAVMADYTFPLVFHIIHQNGPENISDVQILTALDHLNDAFANINFYDENNGVDTKIEFCLAKRDPNGNATTGINRVMSPLTNVDFSTDIALKNLIRWNPLEYINIWLVRSINGGGVAGYAYFPSSHGGLEDGIVMLGSIMPNLGGGHSTLVHEIGHYLGLYHTFEEGCNNNDCLLDGDRVCDTPPDNTTVSPGNCSGIVNSCTTDAQSGFPSDQDDINWNYVDYGNQPCRNGYTQGQADRMSFFIENVRQSLLNSPACQEACLSPIVAGFTASAMMVNIGSTVNFTNTSTGGTNYIWAANGTPFAATLNASYTFNTLGLFEITLDVANSDPNCSGTATATVEVVCPISASFSTSNLYPAPGETVSFSNASIGASIYTWSLNGTNVSTAANFSNTFSSPGQYNICLTAGNGLCSEQFCQLVFVIEELGDGDCDGSFMKVYGDLGVSEYSHTFFVMPDGNMLIGGGKGTTSLLMMVSPGGETLWSKTFNFTTGNDFIFEMMLDSDGMLVATGRDQLNMTTTTFIFKYNLQTHSILWQKLFPVSYSRLETILEKSPGENYYLLGMVNDNNMFMEVNRNTGNLVAMEQFNYGETDFFLTGKVHNGAIYTAGVQRNGDLGDIRASITKLSLAGTQLWTRFYFNNLNQTARTYFYENLIENDTIVAYGRGDFNGNSFSAGEIILMKSDINGEMLWAKRYNLPNSNTEFSGSFIPLPDGYIMQGNHTLNSNGQNEFFIIRVNKQGNLIWAKSIKSIGGDWGKYAAYHDGFIYFTGRTNEFEAIGDVLLGKMSIDGEVVGSGCTYVTDLQVTVNNVTNNYDGQHLLSDINSNYSLSNANLTPLDVDLDAVYFEGCECTEFTPSCEETFVIAYGTPGAEEGRNIIAVPGGFVFVTSKPDSLLFMGLDEEGALLWQRSKHIIDGDNRLLHLGMDSEGNLIGCGTRTTGPAASLKSFAFRYDYQNNNMLWANQYNYYIGDYFFFIGMVEKPNAGNFVLVGDNQTNGPPGQGCDATWVEVNRNTGAIVTLKNFNLGSCETFYSPVISSDGTGIYLTGRHNTAGGGQNKFRGPITKMDWNGNQLWSRLYLVPVSAGSDARMYGVSLIEENGGLYTFGHGDLNGVSLTDVSCQFYKTDLDGNIEWAWDYDIVGASSESAIKALSSPDGFLLLGFFTQGNRNICLLKVNKQGNLQWAKSYGGPGDELGWDLEYQNGKIFLVGKTSSFGNGSDDALLLKLDLDGNIQNTDCDFSADLVVTTTAIPNPYDGSHPLTFWTPSASFTSMPGNPQPTTITESQLCYDPCPDTCTNGLPIHTMPDAVLQSISGQCDGDSLLVALEVCNADSVALPAGTPVSFYQNNPTATTANLLATIILPSAVAPGSCEMFNTELALPINQQIFVVVNDNGATPTPFDLFSDFPNNSINECDYTNNIANFEVIFTAPLLDLGPDISACHFEVVELDAGPGFATYQWSAPGNNGQTFTAWEPGTYSVTVTDDCGGTQSDEITISVLPTTIVEIGVDTALICAGGSISFAASSFAGYQWFPAGLVNCDTCAAITATSTVDTCLTLLAATTDGCYSTDTVCLQIIPSILTTDTVNFCQGDTVTIFGNLVTQPGDYVETFTTPDGCDSTHSIVLTVFDTVSTSETISICENGSADIFGTPISMPGIYSQTFQTFNGCDSTHTISLLVADTIYASQMIAICAGDSALIFGNWETLPGTFSQVLSSTSGCDSISVIELAVNDTYQTAESVTICSNETADIFGIPTNIAGDYSQTLQSVAGCDSTHTITLIVFDTASIGEVINICENEMADVFGTPTNVPGIYAQTFQNLNGCDSTYTIQLLVNDTLMVAESINICEGDSALIFGNWEKQAGMFMQVFSTATGCDSTVAVELTVFPVATTNETIAICENQTANVFGTPTNVAGVYTQTFQTTTGCDSTHTIELTVLDTVMTNETIVICENETADIFGMPTNVAGTYSQSSLMANGCDSLHTILLLVNDTVQTSESVSICFGDSAFIFGNWETLPGNYSQVSQTTNGCDSTHTVTLAVGSQISLSLQSQSSCAGQMDGSVEATIAGGNPPYTYQWNVPGQTGSTLSGLPPGPYAVTVIDANGCSSTGSTVVVSQADLEVQLDIVDVSCFGFADGSLNVIAQPPGLYYYSLDGIDYQASTDWSNTNMPPGNYTLYVYNVIGCLWEFPFTIHEPPPVFVSLPPDVTIELGETITLNATTGQDSLLFSWYPDLWLSCDDCPRPAANPEATTLYTVMVFDQNDCSASDSILVMVEFTPGIYVPNAFSPNGDGINDLFYIQGKGISEVRLLRVFDRWGEMVFESSNFLPNDPLFGWDGTFKGKKMNPAVFAYYAELNMLDGTNRAVKGDVTLLR